MGSVSLRIICASSAGAANIAGIRAKENRLKTIVMFEDGVSSCGGWQVPVVCTAIGTKYSLASCWHLAVRGRKSVQESPDLVAHYV